MTDYMKSRRPGEEGDGFFCRFTFGQFFALLVLEVFTIFFVFYLGARYGPQFLGFQKKGATVVGQAPQEEASAGAMTTDSPEVAAMAKDIVNKAKSPELKERLAQMLSRPTEGKAQPPADVERADSEAAPSYPPPPAQQAAANRPENTGIPGADEPGDESAQALAPGQVPMRQAAAPAEVEQGAVRIKSAENAKYSLQIGSYQQMAEANTAIEKWKAKGYRAFLMIADIPDRGRWYRVRVGGFASREEAKKYQQQFESQEAVQAIVVMNEQ
jgi:cell division protein FtsN